MTAKSNKLTERDFDRLKSGQTVWRVWFLVPQGKLIPHVEKRAMLGKRVGNKHKTQKKGNAARQFFCKDEQKRYSTSFISDLKGMGCFWTKNA
jgi:hypothetical protein